MIVIDGSMGEGGGQVLRSSLSLSAVTGQPVRLERIRAGRAKPGLMRQHLTAVLAAQAVCGAEVEGASLGSQTLTFKPGQPKAGAHRFAIGSAGSASLVLQTVAPVLLSLKAPSTVRVEGGTHNDKAPPFEFLEQTWLPVLQGMGADMLLQLERAGLYPTGGGILTARFSGGQRLAPLSLLDRGPLQERCAFSRSANLDGAVGSRQRQLLIECLGYDVHEVRIQNFENVQGTGNLCQVIMNFGGHREVFTQFGERGRPSEDLVKALRDESEAYLASDAPVGEHLADQLLLPLALHQGGAFRTSVWSSHSRTNAEVIQRFLGSRITAVAVAGAWEIEVRP